MGSLRRQYIIVFLAIALVPLVLTTGYIVHHARNRAEAKALDQLGTLAAMKQTQLSGFLESLAQSARAVAGNRFLVQAMEDYRADGGLSQEAFAENANYQAAFSAVRDYQEAAWGAVHHIFVVDPKRQVVLSPPHGDSTGSHLGHHVDHPALDDAFQGEPQITDFFGFSEKTHFHQLRMDPVKNAAGETLGVLVVEVVIAHQLELLAQAFETNGTSRVYMATLDGQEIVHSKEDQKPPIENAAVAAAIADGGFTGRWTNSAGTPVHGVCVHDPQYPWVLCLETESSEVFALANDIVVSALPIVGAVIIAVIFVSFWLTRQLVRPILNVVAVLKDIAEGEGDLTKRLDESGRGELGELAKWFNTFVQRLQRMVVELADKATALASGSTELSATATEMTDAAETTSHQSASVSAAAEKMAADMNGMATSTEHMSSNIKTVAAAVEELTASIGEVAKNAEQASGVADNAARLADTSNASVGQLGSAAEGIGSVIQTIQDIAEQTNLLALNATIEAARAGDAGKGFAVVATEVKELAKQTADATEDIRKRIEGIQGSSEEAVRAIAEIGDVIEKVNGVSSTIASAVEEQRITTSEIAQSVAQSAGAAETVSGGVTQSAVGSRQITENIAAVDQAARQSSDGANRTRAAASKLTELSQQVQSLVGQFEV